MAERGVAGLMRPCAGGLIGPGPLETMRLPSPEIMLTTQTSAERAALPGRPDLGVRTRAGVARRGLRRLVAGPFAFGRQPGSTPRRGQAWWTSPGSARSVGRPAVCCGRRGAMPSIACGARAGGARARASMPFGGVSTRTGARSGLSKRRMMSRPCALAWPTSTSGSLRRSVGPCGCCSKASARPRSGHACSPWRIVLRPSSGVR